MFFGRNNNNNSGVNTNTTFLTLFSDVASLTISGWNDMISLRFLPAIGKDANGLTQYNKDAKISTSLKPNNSKALLRKIEKKIIPAYENGDKHKTVTVKTRSAEKVNTITISYKLDDDGEAKFSLIFAGNVNENGVAEQGNIIIYPFNNVETLEDYDPTVGGGDDSKESAEFFNFVDILKHHIDLLGLNHHAVKHATNISRTYNNGNNSGGFNNQPSSAGDNNFTNMFGSEELPFN